MSGMTRKFCAAAIALTMPIVWSSAQQSPGRLDARRQSSRYSNRSRSSRSDRAMRIDGAITYPAKPLPEAYSILLRQSIFSKDRTAAPDPNDRPQSRPTPESQVVLRGVMREGEHFLANIEDTGPRRIKWLGAGDSLPSNRGRIDKITLDGIVISRNGTQRQIAVGESVDAGKVLASDSADVGSAPANH
jgi:hypothetical protein